MIHPAVYIIFIGGAADKESFLWGNINLPFTHLWPHHTVGALAASFEKELSARFEYPIETEKALYYKIDYLSYTDVFFEELKDVDPTQAVSVEPIDERYKQIKKNIGQQTKVYIVGHSLGGWNGAHLSSILSKSGVDVEYLITLDPVGTGNHEVSFISPLMKKAQIYRHEPMPIAKNWFNVQARHIDVAKKQMVGLLEDWVAWAGGQWLINQHYSMVGQQVCEKTNFSHKEALEMFTYRTKLGHSPHEYLLDAVVKTIKQRKRQRYNPVFWFRHRYD